MIYNTIDDIPKNGTGYSNLSIYTTPLLQWEMWDSRSQSWIPRTGTRVPTGDKTRNVQSAGDRYNVRYQDEKGDDHSGGLDAFLQRSFAKDIQIQNIPEGMLKASQVPGSGVRITSNFITEQEAGGQTAGNYQALRGGEKEQELAQQASVVQTPAPTTQTQKYGDILTTDSGQKIDPNDPNYSVYAKQMGIIAPTDTKTTITPNVDTGFQLPEGYQKISGAQYNTRELQQSAFSDIQTDPTNTFLYGKPIVPTNQPIEPAGESSNIDTSIDLTQPIKTDAIDKSTEMLGFQNKVADILKEQPTGVANNAFVQTVAQAKFGQAATQAQLDQFIGKSLQDVVSGFGLDIGGAGIPKGIEFKPGMTDAQKTSITNLMQKPRSDWTEQDVTNYNFATGSNEVYKPKETPNISGDVNANGGTIEPKTNASGQTKTNTALDRIEDLVKSYADDKAKVREDASKEAGTGAIQTEINTAQAGLNALKLELDQMQSDVDLQDILNEEVKIALSDKLSGQAIPMSSINKQLASQVSKLSQEQRMDRLYDIYALNSKVNVYNAQIANMNLLQGKYKQATDNIKDTIDDWKEMKVMELDLLEAQGVLEKEQRAEAQAEIDFQNSLGLQGYVKVENPTTYNKMVKDLGVTADTFGQYFFKAANGNIYKKPAQEMDTEIITANGRKLLIDSKTGNTIKDLGSSSSGGGTKNTITVGNEKIVETGDTFQDTVNFLKSLRNQNMLTDFAYNEQINALMKVGGYSDSQRGELESSVNRAMEGTLGSATSIDVDDDNLGSDFIVDDSPFKTTTPSAIL